MLGDGLNNFKSAIHQKSSIMVDQKDPKRLRQIIDQKDETIHHLKKKIDQLEKKLSKKMGQKNVKIERNENSSQQNNFFQQNLKEEMDKVSLLQAIIEQLTERIDTILFDMAKDESFSETTIDLQQMIQKIPIQGNIINSSSYSSKNSQLSEMNITHQCNRKIDILQGLINTFKSKNRGIKQEKKSISQKLQSQKQYISDLQMRLKENQDVKMLKLQLKEQRKQRQRLKGLLQRSEIQKNQLTNKINTIGLKDEKIKLKSKQQLLQYSKELNYRIKDLQKEKDDLVKESTKQKELQLKKYMNVLNKLKIIKENSRMGQSFA